MKREAGHNIHRQHTQTQRQTALEQQQLDPGTPSIVARRAVFEPAATLRTGDVLALQRSMGNRATHRLLGRMTQQRAVAAPNMPLSQRKPVPLQRTPRIIQRIGELPFKDSYQRFVQDPDWHKQAEAYERSLGSYAYNHPKAVAAAKGALDRLKEVLVSYYHDMRNGNDNQLGENEILKAFGKDDTTSAGQVGEDVNRIREVFAKGNLREQMTAFYNAAYYKAGKGPDLGVSLKAILHDITLGNTYKEKLAKDLRLDAKALKDQSGFLKGYQRSLLYKGANQFFPGKAYNFGEDIFALGNLTYQSDDKALTNTLELAKSQKDRKDRSDAEKAMGPKKKTPRDYDTMNTPLSDREIAYLKEKNSPLKVMGFKLEEIDKANVTFDADGKPVDKRDNQRLEMEYKYKTKRKLVWKGLRPKIEKRYEIAMKRGKPVVKKYLKVVPEEKTITNRRAGDLKPGEQGPELPLEWIEGSAWFEIDPNAEWYKKVHDQMGMPVVAGLSGTTARMLSAFKWLQAGNPLDFRLAIMGWMLTSWDHSLYEIFRGSQIAGVTAGETTANVVDMYKNVPPLTAEELRTKVCIDNMFPHEHIYMKQTQESDKNKPQLMEPGSNIVSTGKQKYEAIKKEAAAPGTNVGLQKQLTDAGTTATDVMKRLSPAHAVAIAGYTGGMHDLLNVVMTMPEVVARRSIKSKLHSRINYYIESWLLDAKEFELSKTGKSLPKEEQERKQYLQEHYEEWIASLDPFKKLLLDEADKVVQTDPNQPIKAMIAAMKPTRDSLKIDEVGDKLYDELKIHANMTIEGLMNLPPVNNVTVYRGDWKANTSWAYSSNNLTFNQFTSTSRDEKQAKDFAKRYANSTVALSIPLLGEIRSSYPILLKMKLTGKGGRDISYLSKFTSEKEILLMPGTKFQTDANGYRWDSKEKMYIWEMTEV